MSDRVWWSTGSGRIELQIDRDDAKSASHAGRCDDDVLCLSRVPYIRDQLAEIPSQLLAGELKEYGAWNESELADRAQNLQRLLWLACGDVADGNCG